VSSGIFASTEKEMETMNKLYTIADAARELKISYNAARYHAHRYNIGKQVGQRLYLLDAGELEQLRERATRPADQQGVR